MVGKSSNNFDSVTKVDPLGVGKYGEAWHRKINMFALGAAIALLLAVFFFAVTLISFRSSEVHSVNK
jgi:hypothetical protein